MTITKKWRWILLITLAASIIGLLCMASIGYFVRPMADDFYYMSVGESPPLRHSFGSLFGNGRVSSIVFYLLLYPVPFFLRFVPLLTIVFVAAGFFVPIRLVSKRKYKNDSLLITSTISATATLVTLLMLPGLYSSVFWFSAAPVHVWSFSFLLMYLGLLWHYGRKDTPPTWWLSALVFGVGALFVGDLYEASSGILIVSSLLVLLLTYYKHVFAYRRIGWLSLAGSFASLIVLLFSPGALHRRHIENSLAGGGMFDRIGQLPQVVWQNFTSVAPGLFNNYGALVILFICTTVFSIFCLKQKINNKKGSLMILAAILACLLAATINVAVVWVGEGQLLPLRAYFLPALLLVILALIVGDILGQTVKEWPPLWIGGAAGALLTIGVTFAITNSFFIPYVRDFRGQVKLHTIAWDKRDSFIKQSLANNPGICDLRVANLPLLGGGDISPKRDYWRNTGITSYYYPPSKFKDFHCRIYAQKWVPWAHRY